MTTISLKPADEMYHRSKQFLDDNKVLQKKAHSEKIKQDKLNLKLNSNYEKCKKAIISASAKGKFFINFEESLSIDHLNELKQNGYQIRVYDKDYSCVLTLSCVEKKCYSISWD